MKYHNLHRNVCDRCQAPIKVSIMSKLNTDILCMLCKEDEKALPGYEAGAAAELAVVRQGNYNFPGVGLTPDDHAFLAKRRAARTNHSTETFIPCHPAERQEWAASFPRLGSVPFTFQTASPDDDWREHFSLLQRDRDLGLPAALEELATKSFRDLITSAKTCLRENLLCLGGWGVCQPALDEDLHNILSRGFVLTGDPVRLYPGEPSSCHHNTSALWQKHRDTAAIMTGYALSIDGLWRQHSWLIGMTRFGKPIIGETTERRVAYCGFMMSEEEAAVFADTTQEIAPIRTSAQWMLTVTDHLLATKSVWPHLPISQKSKSLAPVSGVSNFQKK